jgi:hypothetical protein
VVSGQAGTESGAVDGKNGPIIADLASVIDRWRQKYGGMHPATAKQISF